MSLSDRANKLQQKISSSGEVTTGDEVEAERIYSDMVKARGGSSDDGCWPIALIAFFLTAAILTGRLYLL